VNIIAIEKVIPENIGIAVGILFLYAVRICSLSEFQNSELP